MPYPPSHTQPRPILKQYSTSTSDSSVTSSYTPSLSLPGVKVHFPQHPFPIASTYAAHSPNVYDRSPISVKPNECALPARNCRTYRPGSPYVSSKDLNMDIEEESGSDIEWTSSTPGRGWNAIEKTPTCKRITGFSTKIRRDSNGSSSSRSPPLIPDMSSTSSSDDSDQPPRDHFLRTSNPTFSYTSPQSDNSKLAFLPHPHTSKAGPQPRGRSRTRDSPHRGRRERAHVDEGCLGGF